MASHLESLRLQAKSLPEEPGVYFWLDDRDRTLYIGKAINLRARVTSYFSTARKEARTRRLIMQARRIRYESAPTELDALFRESALIKEQKPPFNRALKTPRKLFYLKLDAANSDPYPEIVREVEEDGSLYFGPFQSAAVLREALSFVHEVLPLRKCTAMKPRCRPCLYNQMRTCAAPLLDQAHREKHQQAIAHLFDLLDGRSDRVTAWLEAKRDRLAEALMFERAAEVQRRLEFLHRLMESQQLLDAAVRCRCVLVRTAKVDGSADKLLLVAHGAVLSVREVEDVSVPDVVRWIRAHDPLLRAMRSRESELDAASVLQRWVAYNRRTVRWVAIPHDASEPELGERVGYVLERSYVPSTSR